MTRIFASALALGSVVAVAIASGPAAHAASLPASVGTLDKVAAKNTTAVRYHRRYRHWRGGWRGYRRAYGFGWGWGWPYYYGATVAAPYYYYEPPIYYEPAPVYRYRRPEPPRGAIRQCWVDTDSSRGFGYWRPC